MTRGDLKSRRKGNLAENTFGKILFGSQKAVENANSN
jgi:Polysaccharide deacetylase